MTRTVTILGSTGSVGTATLDIIRDNPQGFSIKALTAHRNVQKLADQAKQFNASTAVIADEKLYPDLKSALAGTNIEAAAGADAVTAAAGSGADIIMAAIVGMAGIQSVLAAVRSGKHVAIANKEPLVAAGSLILAEAAKSGAKILPVDSEHNAIFQVFENENHAAIKRLILTASGGPFRDWTSEQMVAATPAQALAHPNWSMGPKISIDSATMMNKALEVIEAHHLFAMPAKQIDVLMHPQSVVHSMVEYEDGSVLAQLGPPDMRVPIASALGWPKRLNNNGQKLDFTKLSTLAFSAVDDRRFPAIKQAYLCLEGGQASCIAFNAANEVAVAAFLAGQIGFLDIFETVRHVVDHAAADRFDDLETILAFDAKMREAAQTCILEERTQTRKAL